MLRAPIFVVATVLLAACGAKPDTGGTADSATAAPAVSAAPVAGTDVIPTTTFAPKLAVDITTLTKMASGVYYKDLVVGAGTELVVGKAASVNYVGTLPDGTQFDAGRYTFTPGAHRVIPGWEEGVPGMKVGGKRLLVIPPDLGYGANGSGPIPPNAVLVFTVELLSVQ